MFTPLRGIAVETPRWRRQCTTPCNELVSTENGWRTVRRVGHVPPAGMTNLGRYSANDTYFAFSDSNRGWILGDRLFVTSDGGKSWSTLSSRDPVMSISLVGSSLWTVRQHCRIPLVTLANGVRTGGVDCAWYEETVSKSNEGQRHAIVQSRDRAYWWPLTVQFGFRISTSKALVTVWNSDHGSESLLGTSDNGQSWQKIPLPRICTYYTQLQQIVFANDREILAYCQGAAAAGSATGVLIRTHSQGRSWTWLSGRLALDCCASPNGVVINEPVLLAATNDGSILWDVNSPTYRFEMSTNGGVSWRLGGPSNARNWDVFIVPIGVRGAICFDRGLLRPLQTSDGVYWH